MTIATQPRPKIGSRIVVVRRTIREKPLSGWNRLDHLAPSPLDPRAPPYKVTIREDFEPTRFRTLAILGSFVLLQLRIWGLRLSRRYTTTRVAELLSQVLQDLGGLWIKVGQLLSLRTDALPREICDALARLQSRAEGFSPEIARRTIEAELGRPIGEIFSYYEAEPFAAASMAQGHRATLRSNGVKVVIKVQRPGIDLLMTRDLKFIRRVVSLLSYFRFMEFMQFGDALWELREIMREEVDYRYEASNLRRLRRNLKKHGVYAPKPYLDLCTERLLVMENIPGVMMSDYIRVRSHSPGRADAWLEENGISPEQVAKLLVDTLLRQIFEDNLFHADLHPGNIMLLKNSRVGLIDFGTAGTLERDFLDLYRLATISIAKRNYRKAVDYILFMSPNIPSINLKQVREEMVRAFRLWEARSELNNAAYFERAVSSATTETNKVMFKYRIQPSWALMKLGRTFGTLDSSLATLIPDGDIRRLYRAYFTSARRRNANLRSLIERGARVFDGVTDLAKEAELLLVPYLRTRTLGMKGAAGKFSEVTALFLRYLRFGIVGAVLATIYTLLLVTETEIADHIRNPHVDSMISHFFTDLPTGEIVLLTIGLLVAAHLLKKSIRILRSEPN